MQKLIPANCPIDLPTEALERDPSLDTLLAVAVGVEAHNNAVNDTLMPYGERLSVDILDKAVGHTACSSCSLLELCKSSVSAAEEIAPEIKHPLDLWGELDAESMANLWSASIVAQAEHNGYTRESSANMVGKIARLTPPLRAVIIKVLESDSTHIPTQLGKVELSDKTFEFVDFGDVRLMISDTALNNLEGNGNYVEGFIGSIADVLMRTTVGKNNSDENRVITRLRNSLETNNFRGLGIKQLTSVAPVREFNGGAHSTLRGFGGVVGRTPDQPDSQDTIVIAHIADAKGGVNGTEREGAKVEKLVNELSAERLSAAIQKAQADKAVSVLQKKSHKYSLVAS